jgi:hypothetical protein
MTSIDAELKEEAKKAGLNISEITEKAIQDWIKKPELGVVKLFQCAFCNEVGQRETIKEAKEANVKAQFDDNAKHPLEYSEPTRLSWLWPDEKWICNKCLSRKCNNAVISG